MRLLKATLLFLIVFFSLLLNFHCGTKNPVTSQIIENITIQHRDDINQDQVWSADSIHVIANSISVRQAILRIEPGTIVKFASDAALSIMDSAGLIADGSIEEINFTSDIKENGAWKHIYFSNHALHDSCRLIKCNFEYGGGDSIRSGIIFCDDASPVIQSCTIKNSANCGIVFRGDCRESRFESNLIANCDFVPVQTYPINVSLLSGNSYQDNGLNHIRIIHRLIDFSAAWENLSLPYRLADGLEIKGGKLVIDAGVNLIFEDNEDATISEKGIIEAIGNPTSRVIFTGAGGKTWQGIHFDATADFQNSRLVHCVIENGGYDTNYPANVILHSGIPEISDCIIHLSAGYGIYISGNLTANIFSNNIITRNASAPITLPANSVPVLAASQYQGNGNDVIEVRGGNIEGKVTQNGYWQNLGVPYLIQNTIDINFGTITLAPGVEILMTDHSRFIVRNGGGFIADGTFLPIKITRSQANQRNWDNIYFSPSASEKDCQLVNCIISHGGGDTNLPGMIYCDNVSPTVKSCFIQHSQTWGIYLNGNARIFDLATNFFQGNVYGDFYQSP